jgi:hypothetical protein
MYGKIDISRFLFYGGVIHIFGGGIAGAKINIFQNAM